MQRPATPPPTSSPTWARALLAVVLAVTTLLAAAPTARAESAYRYWAYFTAESGAWAPAMTGPADVVPEDGSVQAMRFAVHGSEARPPRTAPDFDSVCAGVEPSAEGPRVAVLVDPGTAEDAPDGGTGPAVPTATCVVAAEGDTALDVLGAVAELRDEGGLICALDGYPATGCGDPAPAADVTTDAEVAFEVQPPVGAPAPSQPGEGPTTGTDGSPAEDSAGTGTGLITLAAVVGGLVVITAGALLARRNRRGRP